MDMKIPIHTGNKYGVIHADGNTHLVLGNVYNQSADLTKEQRCCQIFKTSSYEYHKDRNPSCVVGTCRWALEHPHFQEWRSSQRNALLWISADPGCGKSVLSKALVDGYLPNDHSPTVCYFFFQDNEEQDNLATALCAILHQLYTLRPHLIRHALEAWEDNGDKLREETLQMWRILQASATDPHAGPVVCILDALDECQDTDRRQLIELLCDLQQRSRHSTGVLKVLVTSRPYDNVQRWFERATSRWPHIRLRGEDENDQIRQEINLVIDRRVRDLEREFSLSSDVCKRLQRQLLNMQHRTYLWLYLAMEEIRDVCRDSIFSDDIQIGSLPTSVEDAYERILGRINERQRSLARRVLLIIVGARRALSVQEMALALSAARASEQKTLSLPHIDAEKLERQIREQCGLFVYINHSQLFLIHQTAKNFLIAHASSLEHTSALWKYCLHESQIEREMTSICVTYLHAAHTRYSMYDTPAQRNNGLLGPMIADRNQDFDHSNSFWEYCAEYWAFHLKDDFLQQNEYLLKGVLALFKTDEVLLHKWFPIMWKFIYPYVEVPALSCLHVIAITGHAYALQKMLEEPEMRMTLNAKDSTNRTALHWAAERGHQSVVELLLKQHVDVDAEGGLYGSALQLASARGREQVVQLLLDQGADSNAQDGFYGNALQAASTEGHEQVIELLLARGADPNARGGLYGSALELASARGHEQVVRHLLDRGADVNARGGVYNDALQAASAEGYDNVVRLLLDYGADPKGQGGFYGSALTAATERGHEEVAQLLLDRGAVSASERRYSAVSYNWTTPRATAPSSA